jgi:pimeloyl-ACP methyl ester carboxylesterase/glycine cleavage system regulatory protein
MTISSSTVADDRLTWQRIEVDGRSASFGVGGAGPPVVFLHGWALGSRTYRRAMRRLTERGCQVFAPSLPGFGGTSELPRDGLSIGSYATWVDHFMAAVGIEEPALVIGHSFGGGVATKLAFAYPERVSYLVLLNSVGGVGTRPIWALGVDAVREVMPHREGVNMMLAIRHDLLSNIVHNPGGLLRVGTLARTADLTVEMAELRRRGLPVLALTTDKDGVIPQGAFETLCRAIGTDGQVLTGRHSWLLSDPDTFGEVLANVLEVRTADHRQQQAQTRAAEIADALRDTRIPARRVASLLGAAPPLWLLSAPTSVLAADLTLCHPKLRPGELRAVARRLVESNAMRLTVVAPDRRGLLADTAGAITAHGLSITEASAATWRASEGASGIALHALTVHGADSFAPDDWERLGEDLRSVVRSGVRREFGLPPTRATVTVYGAGADRSLVRLTAPDLIGLLWTVCDWFARHGVGVESLDASTRDGMARDVFLVSGTFLASDLTGHLLHPGGLPTAR